MNRCIWLLFFSASIFADILVDLEEQLPSILNGISEVEGDFAKVEPFPDEGGSFINAVYLVTTSAGEEFALKVENPNWKDKKTLNEVVSINHLARRTSIPVPYVMYFENDLVKSPFSAEYILMKRVKGKPLNHVIESIRSNKEQYSELLAGLADVIAELKSQKFNKIGNFKGFERLEVGEVIDFPLRNMSDGFESFSQYAKSWLGYYCSEMKRLRLEKHQNSAYFDKYIPILERWLSRESFTFLDKDDDVFVYSHQDFVMKNILVEGSDVTAVLDWEWSGSALPEFEAKTGFDFLYSSEDKRQFSALLEERGVYNFFKDPPLERQIFYRLIGDIYSFIACYEWLEGKLEHTAKFLDQKLEQRKVRGTPNFDMTAYLEKKDNDLDYCILKFDLWMKQYEKKTSNTSFNPSN